MLAPYIYDLAPKIEDKKNIEKGVGGCQSGGAGSFLHTKREVFGGTKYLFEFGVKYLNISATHLSFGGIYLNCGAIYLYFGDKN